jgi:hypothetical protein
MAGFIVTFRGAYPNDETGFRGVSGYSVGGTYRQAIATSGNLHIRLVLTAADTPSAFAAYSDM